MPKREYAVLAIGRVLVSEDRLGDGWILVTSDNAVEHAAVPEKIYDRQGGQHDRARALIQSLNSAAQDGWAATAVDLGAFGETGILLERTQP